ncbi:DUF1349 domain-containing protein [Nonomuraea sp. NBC_01738]|uniref:hypothetical protein n=1 Tax=Nonomuraea sp. NBC_01738 TaxID=2976003 RepID=UPI002E11C1A9|nr:DUF1349 domain-containing protein [Nonomuraea sp. NBC_01738]
MESVRAQWTRFRTARGWMIGMVIAALLPVAVGLGLAATSHATCGIQDVEGPCPPPTLGPGGQAVDDKFYFVHQSLRGDGSITARITGMTGRIKEPPPPGTGPGPMPVPGLVPWAKAGLLVKDGIKQGSSYAAIMMTAEHGVRMQHDFTEDVAGSTGGFPRWLRLTRAGDTITGAESADGRQWTEVSRARLAGMPETVEIGLFATSPGALTMSRGGPESRFAEATGVFDNVGIEPGGSAQTSGNTQAGGGAWKQDDIGVTMEPGGAPHHPGGFTRDGDTFRVTGVGDIAPSADGQPIERVLVGGFAALIVMIVVAVTFVTSRRRPGGGLAAGAAVLGAVAFVVGALPAAVVIPLSLRMLPANGIHPLPVGLMTHLRVIVGTGLLFAAVAVLSAGLAVLLRRAGVAIAVTLAVVFLPYVLALAGAGAWLLALTPASGFAIQQSLPVYPQVDGFYLPKTGYFPLPPWAGLGVLAAYTALTVAGAWWVARKRYGRQHENA